MELASLVKVPLKTSQHLAYVVQIHSTFYSDFKVREILGLQQFPDDIKYAEFIEKISKFYFVPKFAFLSENQRFFADKKAPAVANRLRQGYAKEAMAGRQDAPLYPGASPG